MAAGLEAVAWGAAWLAPLAGVGQAVAARVAAGGAVHEALNAALDEAAAQSPTDQAQSGVRFVPQASLPVGQAYEDFIFKTRQVPTRDGLHDFFNGLAWLHFPQTKRRLNELQSAQIAKDGIGRVRGPVRDAITVLDENAAFLSAPDALWDLLVAKDWQALFVAQRHLWRDARLVLFGHALLEKLTAPRKPITAHVYRAQMAIESIAEMDASVASGLTAARVGSKPFAHLPVLGVPGWWAANESPAFYDDPAVFRPYRVATPCKQVFPAKPCGNPLNSP